MSDARCCPFCGAGHKYIFMAWDDNAFWVTCEFCGAKGPRSENSDDAETKWNRRESK